MREFIFGIGNGYISNIIVSHDDYDHYSYISQLFPENSERLECVDRVYVTRKIPGVTSKFLKDIHRSIYIVCLVVLMHVYIYVRSFLFSLDI